MDRLTSDSPDGNFETMLNFVYGKDGWAYIRHDGEYENVLLTDWAKRQCQARGCEEVTEDSPEEIDQRLCDCMVDSGSVICPIAMAYCFASQACHMRSRLKMYEDSCLTPEEIYQHRFIIAAHKDLEKLSRLRELIDADADGRLVVLPLEAKNGDPIPQCFYGDDGLCPGLSASSDDEPIEMCKRCWYCSTGYHWEAEAALEKREADDETD